MSQKLPAALAKVMGEALGKSPDDIEQEYERFCNSENGRNRPDEHDHQPPKYTKPTEYPVHQRVDAPDLLDRLAAFDALRKESEAIEKQQKLVMARGRALAIELEQETETRFGGLMPSDGCKILGIVKFGDEWWVVGHQFHTDQPEASQQFTTGLYL